ncbi:hypothetical protein ACFVAV_29930 [Nocardia sp. NPDC057663]
MTTITAPRPGLLPTDLRVAGWSVALFGVASATTFAALETVGLGRADR